MSANEFPLHTLYKAPPPISISFYISHSCILQFCVSWCNITAFCFKFNHIAINVNLLKSFLIFDPPQQHTSGICKQGHPYYQPGIIEQVVHLKLFLKKWLGLMSKIRFYTVILVLLLCQNLKQKLHLIHASKICYWHQGPRISYNKQERT